MATTINTDGFGSVQEMVESLPAWKRILLGLQMLPVIEKTPYAADAVQLFSLCINGRTLRQLLRRFEDDSAGRRLLRERPTIDETTVNIDALAQLPAGTLGYEYAHVLKRQNYGTFVRPEVKTDIEFVSYRLVQVHDILHVVAGYGMDVLGELELQGFLHGQQRLPTQLLITLLGGLELTLVGARPGNGAPGLKHKIGIRDFYQKWSAAYQRGRTARFALAFPWEDHWATPLVAIREQLGLIKPSSQSALAA
jgi:ubiquinone biosynthesis protein COQ4